MLCISNAFTYHIVRTLDLSYSSDALFISLSVSDVFPNI